jgi:hypothetical protein
MDKPLLHLTPAELDSLVRASSTLTRILDAVRADIFGHGETHAHNLGLISGTVKSAKESLDYARVHLDVYGGVHDASPIREPRAVCGMPMNGDDGGPWCELLAGHDGAHVATVTVTSAETSAA